MSSFFHTNNTKDCCGCTACVNVCPKNCIEFKENEEGFLYPSKDQSKCISCGLCELVCPFVENDKCVNTGKVDVYAAFDNNNREGSSSGGLFYTFAKYVIEEKNGWVFGAAFDDNFKLVHIGVNTLQDLEKLRGSKYIQSDLFVNKTYAKIKDLLLTGHFVLFVGTPCQVAGLKLYIREKNDNLLTIDIVCHGVPSQYIFNEHIDYLEHKHRAKLSNYQFRKNNGWGGCEIVDFTNPFKRVILPSYDLSPYLYSFMHSYTYRESCYHCKYTNTQRAGDITLADYWGVRLFFPLMDYRKGVSLLLINSTKGNLIWDLIKSDCTYEASNIEDASKYNWNLNHVSSRPKERDDIYLKIKMLGYENVMGTIHPIHNNLIRESLIRMRDTDFVDNLVYHIRRMIYILKDKLY